MPREQSPRARYLINLLELRRIHVDLLSATTPIANNKIDRFAKQ